MSGNQKQIIKMAAVLALLCIAVAIFSRVAKNSRETLSDYAEKNPEIAYMPHETASSNNQKPSTSADKSDFAKEPLPTESTLTVRPASNLTGANLNSSMDFEKAVVYSEGFYYEELSDNLKRYITGVSFPSADSVNSDELVIGYDNLRYMHIWHYNFGGEPAEGELICNALIADDLVEIFAELYKNEYQIEKVRLIDEYDGDDTASMEDNNTSCFNYRVVEGTTSISKHAYGFAIDINPLYNPYITYKKDGSVNVSPASGAPYADRGSSFPYKIDENDLCYKLFKEHGFTWGGDWNSVKDYQHFQKVVE